MTSQLKADKQRAQHLNDRVRAENMRRHVEPENDMKNTECCNQNCPARSDTYLSAGAAQRIAELEAELDDLRDTVQFVERWAVHHGTKPSVSAKEALSVIQHYPSIHDITKSYADGKRPETFNPFARIAELEAELEAVGAGGVQPLRKDMVPLSDVLERLAQGFGRESAPVTTIRSHFERAN